MPLVIAVVVTYKPEISDFLALIDRLLVQVGNIVVVDNSENLDDRVFEAICDYNLSSGKFSIIRIGSNSGVAVALNLGIQEAIRCGAEFILLSDQDSLPADGMVENLRRAYEELTAQGVMVGAVGPTFSDLNTALTFPFQVQSPGKFFYGHKISSKEEPHVEALSLITSGSLIPREVIEAVGPMREDFFIDSVDVEWCHRARSMGYRLFGTGWAAMYQRLGEAKLRVWYLRWRYESEYSPIRSYYRLRNLVALWKLDFIDWRWKVRNVWYGLGVVYTHTFFSKKNKAEHFFMAVKGVWHGLTNRMGPYRQH
jgi:rhamnosyltransferase